MHLYIHVHIFALKSSNKSKFILQYPTLSRYFLASIFIPSKYHVHSLNFRSLDFGLDFG